MQLDTMIVRSGIGVESPKTELPQPRLQSRTWFLKVPLRNKIAVRYFRGGRATALVAFPARIPSSPRSLLSTAVTNESWSCRVPGGAAVGVVIGFCLMAFLAASVAVVPPAPIARHENEYCDVCVNRSDDNMLDVCFQVSQRLTSDPTTTPQQCNKGYRQRCQSS